MKEKDLEDIAKEIADMDPQATDNLSANEETALGAALADLDGLEELEVVHEVEAAAVTEEVVEEPVAEEETVEELVLSDDDLQDLELQVDKAEAYEAQDGVQIETVDKDKLAAAQKPAKQASKPRAAGAPRTSRDLNAVTAKVFVLTGDASKMSQEELDKAKSDAIAAKPTQIKVAEKFENVFVSMEAGRTPSKYVMTAFAALDQNKTMQLSDVIAAFKASGVGEGTARSQGGQIMVLFDALGIAKRDGKKLDLCEDSNVAAYLRGLTA